MESLGAYSQGCMLELCGILPSNEETKEAAEYLKLITRSVK